LHAVQSTNAEAVLLTSLFDRLPQVLCINLAIALCVVMAFAAEAGRGMVGLWFGAMLLVLTLRLKHWWDFQRCPETAVNGRRWSRRFTAAAGLNGAIWGLAGVMFYDPQSLTAQIFLPFILAGMSGGSLVGLSGCMPAFLAFCLCLTAPYALRLAWEGDQIHLIMALAITIYVLGIGWLGRAFNGYLRGSVRLAGENERLVAALQEKSAELLEKSSQLEATFETIKQGVAVFDRDDRLVTCNRRYQELCREPAEVFASGDSDPGRALDPLDPAGMAPGEDALLAARRRCEPLCFERRDAAGRCLQIEDSPMPGGGFVRTTTDVTNRKRNEARILHLAQHDSLTDLPNRLLFQDRLEQALRVARRQDSQVAVLLLDLDRFKAINDTFGHAAGDLLLQKTAARLRSCVRAADTLARLGGDEFVIVQSGGDQPDAAEALARRIGIAFESSFDLDDHVVRVASSIGIALGERGEDMAAAGELLRRADLALYRAKTGEGCGWCFFEESMSRRLQTRKSLECDLRRALAEQRLQLHYQPQISLETGRVTGVEALVRWHHPERGWIPPAEFIPLAEESDLIVGIGEWVLKTACAEAVAWPSLSVAVNLSPVQLERSNLAAKIETVLAETGLPAARSSSRSPKTSCCTTISG
jgi:diguanylate cyclase (GGDEF)-like protein